MKAHTALVIGEVLIDEFPDRRVVAGAPLHVAVHLSTAGWAVSALTRVGDDADGRDIVAVLERFGVNTSLVEVDPVLPTGTTTIEMSGTDHSFTVNRPAAWDAIGGPPVPPEADVAYFGSLVMRDERSRSTIDRVLASFDGTVVVDLNLRAPDYDEERIRRAVQAADILKLNETELPEACRAFRVPVAIESLHSVRPEWICVTRGGDGAALSHRTGRTWEAAAPPVDVVDTVGAGDAFCAALIDGLVTGQEPDAVLAAAVARGAEIAAQRGGLPEPPGPR